MGTLILIELVCADGAQCDKGFALVSAILTDIDAEMTIYRESALTRINAAAGSPGFMRPVSADTAKVLKSALTVAAETNGLFDPTIAPLLDAYKLYANTPAQVTAVPADAEIAAAHKLVDFRKVILANGSAGLLQKGMKLDLGAIAKGYALDKIAAALPATGISEFSLNFGGHLAVHGLERISVVYDPRDPKTPLFECRLRRGSLSASAQNQRYALFGDKKIGHLINAKTGNSEDKTLITLVYHDSAMMADAWSTALFFTTEGAFDTLTKTKNLTAHRLLATGSMQNSERAMTAPVCVRPRQK